MIEELKDSTLSNQLAITPKIGEFDCETHGKQNVKLFNFGGSYQRGYCPKCQIESQEKREEKHLQDKKADEEYRFKCKVRQASMSSMIPERFKIHSFDSFKTNSNDQKGKKAFCKNYADNFSEKLKFGTSLILCGKTGTGKTHLSCAIANQIIQQSGNPVVFLSVMRAIRTVKETYSKSSKLTEQQAINNLSRPDLLILDEVGVQFGSDAEKIILFEIINERYQNMKPTILISNLSPEEITDFIGDRVADRMRENGGTVLKFEWESNRASK